MITGTVAGLKVICSRLAEFLASSESECFVSANTSGSPAPYASFLEGLRIQKSVEPLCVSLNAGSLTARGSKENLAVWCSYFSFPESSINGDHHHPENNDRTGYLEYCTIRAIIEIQDNSPYPKRPYQQLNQTLPTSRRLKAR